MIHSTLRKKIEKNTGIKMSDRQFHAILIAIDEAMPKEETIVYANGDLRKLATYHEKIGFNTCLDIVHNLLQGKV